MADATLAIRGATILDGSGEAAFEGDVEVRGGHIHAVGRAGPATREIDAQGLVLAPGFVDTHTHDDGALLRYPGMEFKLAQGCTSVVVGNCGFSAAPQRPDSGPPGRAGVLAGVRPDWSDLDGYRDAVRASSPLTLFLALRPNSHRRPITRGHSHC